jgi:hypothetical protein
VVKVLPPFLTVVEPKFPPFSSVPFVFVPIYRDASSVVKVLPPFLAVVEPEFALFSSASSPLGALVPWW